MIEVLNAAGVLTKPLPGVLNWSKFKLVEPMMEARTLSPSARYAIAAVEALQADDLPQDMVCLCGATGMMADAFSPATKNSPTGKLDGVGFPRRSRRIHPLNLIRNLQNQVPSALSQRFQIHGKVLNALESPSSLAYLLPNMASMLTTDSTLLLVLASAANRREEKAKRLCFQEGSSGVEGAFAFLLGLQKGRGMLSDGTSMLHEDHEEMTQVFGDGILDAGGRLMTCFLENPHKRILPLRDAWGHRSALHWKGR